MFAAITTTATGSHMKINNGLAVLASALALAATPAFAQRAPTPGHAPTLALTLLSSDSPIKLTVTSPAFKDGAEIPKENTQYGGNKFPGLVWDRGPAGTRSYVAIMQGQAMSRAGAGTSIHLFLFNLPADKTRIEPGMTAAPAGAGVGPNLHGGGEVYVGPHTHTPEKNAYHFQVFALDTVRQVPSTATFEELVGAMKGHVRASGELVGWAAQTPDEK
jgi:para-nitrobenzyl esterase